MFLALALALQQQVPLPQPGAHDVRGILADGGGLYLSYGQPTATPKRSPKLFGKPPAPADFFYHTDAYGIPKAGGDAFLRFRIFAQTSERNQSMARAVAVELEELWNFDYRRLAIDHREDVNHRIVDVYLMESGEGGGEQLVQDDPDFDPPRKANTIYIYDVAHLDSHMEQAREVAHEYGHAVLPPVGGYLQPEYWANGYLGEKLFLRWARDAVAAKQIPEANFMSCPFIELDDWVHRNVDPLVKAAARRKPTNLLIKGTSAPAMAAFHGLVLWCDSIMPAHMFGRSLALIGSTSAVDYENSAVLAAEEATYAPKIPSYLQGIPVWLPVGAGKVVNGKVVERSSGWELVAPKKGLKIVAQDGG